MMLGSAMENPLSIVLSVNVVTVSRHNVGGEHAGMAVSVGRLSNAADTDIDECGEHT